MKFSLDLKVFKGAELALVAVAAGHGDGTGVGDVEPGSAEHPSSRHHRDCGDMSAITEEYCWGKANLHI